MWFLLGALAFAGPAKWEGKDADIEATATISASPDALRAVLLDRKVLERVYPARCLAKVDYEGVKDASAAVRVTYVAALMRRRLDAMAPVARNERVFEVDHLGNKGFITRWTLTPGEAGTEVAMATFLNPPPKPFRGYFFTRVRPNWVQCHVEALQGLESAAR